MLFVAMLVAPFAAGARNVSVEEAREAAAYYMERNSMNDVKPAELTLIHQIDNEDLSVPAAYVFNVSDWGWIIMAASTVIDPVVGFNDEGNLAPWEQLPENMRWWVEGYASVISELQVLDVDGKYDDMAEWTALFDRTLNANAKDGSPRIKLMNETWGQGSNRNPTYNKFCPYDSDANKYTYTGCVATAIAQIMHYYAFPIAATGGVMNYRTETSHYPVSLWFDTLRFDYTKMPNKLYPSTPVESINQVALLSFAAGVAVRMDYGIDGSGTSSASALMGMGAYFKYETGTLLRRSNTSTDNFLTTMRNDLLLRRPVYMAGSSSTGGGADAAGHAWVCCGYRTDNQNQYYLNWGWEGGGDGYFNLRENTQVTPSGYGYNFNVGQEHITGMVPPHADSTSIDFLTAIETVEGNTVLNPAYPNPAMQTVYLPYSTTMAADMQVFSLDGKMVATRRIQPGSGEVTLNVANMPAGIYIYRLGGSAGKFIVR